MAENSNIEWTTHTFNPWRGCTKVSAGCANCYAETLSGRNPSTLGVWGPKGTRVVASESMWAQPIKWNKAAEGMAERPRVFCASLADVFEGTDTMPIDSWQDVKLARIRLLELIRATPNLDWLLLTKRPENFFEILLESFYATNDGEWDEALPKWILEWHNGDCIPDNVWLGTSVEDQKQADERIPLLLEVPAHVRFLSCEPLLGAVDLTRYSQWLGRSQGGMFCPDCPECGVGIDPEEHRRCFGVVENVMAYEGIDWVITGGESGPNARPMHPDWARALRDQCNATKVPFLFKQWGEFAPEDAIEVDGSHGSVTFKNNSSVHFCERGERLYRVGKKRAGRALDGRTWDEYPTITNATL